MKKIAENRNPRVTYIGDINNGSRRVNGALEGAEKI